MFSLVYISRADQMLTDADLLELLGCARLKNEQLGVTGLLLYKDGNFMQLIEGEEGVVRDLYGKISADTRHCNLTVLTEEPRESRLFPDWSMGFRNLKSVDLQLIPGYNEFLNVPLTGEEFSPNPSRGQELLLLFKRIG